MSRKKPHRRDERQKATNAQAAPAEPKGKPRKCDDELTLLVESMKPRHRRFADGVLGGQLGSKAAVAAGFSETSARSIAYRLLRREDVRRYLHLARREMAVAARANLAAIVHRLWSTVTDANATARAKESAMKHLVRIVLADRRGGADPGDDGEDDGLGLTDEKARTIEARILGVRHAKTGPG